jgi:hypothetical protein
MDQKIRPNEVSRAGEGGAKRGTRQYTAHNMKQKKRVSRRQGEKEEAEE